MSTRTVTVDVSQCVAIIEGALNEHGTDSPKPMIALAVLEDLANQLVAVKSDRNSYKESAESWSTRAAQEQLRADEAERLRRMEQDRRLEAENDLQYFASESKAARESRARLVQLWQARGISARSWHAAERTWKP